MSEKYAIAFTKPNQISEILSEACRLGISVLVRYSQTGKAIRGSMQVIEEDLTSLKLGGISDAGMQLLAQAPNVRVEFVLLSKKLVFVSRVLERSGGQIKLAFPTKIVSTERRQNARFRVTQSHAAFLDFPQLFVPVGPLDAPWVPTASRDKSSAAVRVRIDDISLGGLSCVTRFAAIAALWKAGPEEVLGHLVLPSSPVIPCSFTIRWVKKTVAPLAQDQFPQLQEVLVGRVGGGGAPLEFKDIFTRCGCQFVDAKPEMEAALKQYLRDLQMAQSI